MRVMSNDDKIEQSLNRLAKQIAGLRNSKGLTQEQLADKADIDRVALANIETGKRRPTVTTLLKLAESLCINPADFFK